MTEQAKLDLHPEAAKNFDKKAVGLLDRIGPSPLLPQRPGAFRPEVFISAALTEKDIISVGEPVSVVDYRGEQVAMFFENRKQIVGLVDKEFKELTRLVEKMQTSDQLRDRVSASCVLDLGCKWLMERHRGTTPFTFSQYILAECEKKIRDVELWLPIFQLYLQSEIKIGRITFRTISKEMLDTYESDWRAKLDGEGMDAAKVDELFRRDRKNLQAISAATISLSAEPGRAYEIAFQEAEKSVALLRFFHPANLLPYVRSYCVLLGGENQALSTYFEVKEGNIRGISKKSLAKGRTEWVMETDMIAEMRKSGLDIVSGILGKPTQSRTEFESDLLSSLLIYSKNSLAEDPSDKLVYIFTALDSILLKDRNEPIQKNVAERMAFLIGQSTEHRVAIRDNALKAYGLRSDLLHHGLLIDDFDTLEQFMRNAWFSFMALIPSVDAFVTKAQMINELELRKMS